jgi:putative peptidoglycan lipid II flippase
MWFAGVSVAINIAGSLALFPTLKHVGIAVSTSASGWINAILLATVLWRRGEIAPDAALRRRVPLLLLAAILMGAALYFGIGLVDPWLDDPSTMIRAIGLALVVAAGMALYALFAQLTGAADFRKLLALRRRAIPPPGD